MTNFEVMRTELQEFIQTEGLFTEQDRLLVAVSGGVDSMTLLHLLPKLGYQVAVAHMNFGLRGEASDKDQVLVEEAGNLLHVPVFTKRVSTESYAEEHGVSIQMAARDLRYQWFNDLIEEHSFDCLVTAHNANDNLETVLFNLTKGTGIRGLRGMRAKDGNLMRPMLFASKTDIVAFAEANAIQWREDASNADVKYTRNKIRHEVLPVLQEINPSLITHFENTRRRLLSTEQILADRLQGIREQYCKWWLNSFYIKQDWMSGNESDAVILSELLREFDFSFSQCLEIVKAANQAGKLFHTSAFILNVDRRQFIVRKKEISKPSPISIEVPDRKYPLGDLALHLSECRVSDFKKDVSPNEVFIDMNSVRFPLILRCWEQGDTFRPLGMHGKKKISDFLVDQKVPLIEKPTIMVLESEGQICWVVNYRLDDRFKVTDKTKKLLKITCQKSFDDGPITV